MGKHDITSHERADITPSPEARRILTRLAEAGATLAVADGMEMGVVVRKCGDDSARTAVVPRALAEEMALNDWIRAKTTGRIARYELTPRGRATLQPQAAETVTPGGFAEAPARFAGAEEVETRRSFAAVESPLTTLSRRRDAMGAPFLSTDMVTAGERLREDYELARMTTGVEDWAGYIAGTAPKDTDMAAPDATPRARVAAALSRLGPDLGDIALRCCCHLEGVEAAEKALGWSARSGKIVLRIALGRLVDHYRAVDKKGGGMIG